MPASPNPGPGYLAHPDHKVELSRTDARVRVTFAGQTVADTARAMVVAESNYKPVHYIPKADARMDLLAPTAHTTFCPFKGTARYWSIEADGRVSENAVWAYDAPFDEVADLKDHVAFYPSRVDAITVD